MKPLIAPLMALSLMTAEASGRDAASIRISAAGSQPPVQGSRTTSLARCTLTAPSRRMSRRG